MRCKRGGCVDVVSDVKSDTTPLHSASVVDEAEGFGLSAIGPSMHQMQVLSASFMVDR